MKNTDDQVFRANQWFQEVGEIIGTYEWVHSFITDSDMRDEFNKKFRQMVENNPDPSVTSVQEYLIKWHKNEVINSIEEAEKFYNRQMIVMVVTYLELIFEEFLFVTFYTYPDRMYEYLEFKQKDVVVKGAISIKEIIRADSLADLLKDLSEKAASNALSGRFKAQLNNLAKITKEKIPSDLEERLIIIVEQRNRIIHEATMEQVNSSHVKSSLEDLLSLVKTLIQMSKKINIPTDVLNTSNIVENLIAKSDNTISSVE